MKKRITKSIAPNLLTLGNLFAGFTAIIHIADGNFIAGAVFIFIAAIFDMLDGLTARLINAASELGAELDSLCDAVSFGVAPAFMLYKVHFYQLGDIGVLLAALPALGGVLRLARFNVLLSTFEDKLYFRGMPIPSAALTIVSYLVLWHDSSIIAPEYQTIVITAVSVATTLAMVSNVRFDNLPKPTKRSFQERPFVFVMFFAAFVSVILSKGKLVFPVMVFYIVASSLRHFILWLKSKRLAVDDFDETIEEED